MDKKIAVVGIGGVGGFLAGALANTYEHVTLAARGQRKLAIKEHGLVLHSDCLGEIVANPKNVVEDLKEAGEQDYIFICVKNYSLQDVCEKISPVVGEHTVVVPVMNGVDPGECTRKYLGKGIVLDSLIYIVSYADQDYSIVQQGKIAHIHIGHESAGEKEREAIEQVRGLLAGASVDCRVEADIEKAIWKKYVFNCGYNVLTAYYMTDVAGILNDPKRYEEFKTLLKEAMEVAKAKEIHLPDDYFEAQIVRFESLSLESGSSLQRDLASGSKTELETFSGYLVREAKKLGISVPFSEKCYETLRNRTKFSM